MLKKCCLILPTKLWFVSNGTRQFFVYADDVNILDESVHNIEKDTEALVVASKEAGLEATADKSKYVVMSWDRNAARSQNIQTEIIPLKAWKSSNTWEETKKIKILFRKKSSADWRQGMLVIFRWRIFCLSVCYAIV